MSLFYTNQCFLVTIVHFVYGTLDAISMSDFSWNTTNAHDVTHSQRQTGDITLNTQALLQLKQWQNPGMFTFRLKTLSTAL